MKNIFYREYYVPLKSNCNYIFRIMKITFLLMFIFTAGMLASEANSQNVKVTIAEKNMNVRQLLNEIEEQTDYLFIYNKEEVNLNRNIAIKAKNKPVSVILKNIFENTGIVYAMEGNNIVLMKEPFNAIPQVIQHKKITGIITDEKGEPIIGANVVEKGIQNGTITDIDGNFALEVNQNAILEVSYIGYLNKSIPVADNKSLSIILIEDTKTLDEVVVVGYGTQKKVNLTGAVSQVTAEDFKDRPITRMTQALQGVIPNLNVTFGSGKPGTSGSLNIRGNTSINGGSPLVLVDGVPGTLDRINVNDVESVSVLKDASASAIYGARAAFGVILVTTKSAKDGKTQISYSNNFGWITRSTNTDFITSGYWNAKINDDAMYNCLGYRATKYSDEDYEQLLARVNDKTENPDRPWVVISKNAKGEDMYRYYANFDWYNYFYSKSRPKQEHNVSISGANDKMKYLVTGSYSSEDGVLNINTDKYQRFNMRSKVESDITSWLKFSNNTHFFKSTYDWHGLPTNFKEVSGNVSNNPIYHYHAAYVPKNPDGTLTGYTGINSYPIGYGLHNALESGKMKGQDAYNEFTTTFEFTAKILKNLSVTANYTYNQDQHDNMYRQIKIKYSKYPGIMEYSSLGELKVDKLTEAVSSNKYHVINAFTNYELSLGKHSIKAMGGFNQEYKRYKLISTSGQELLSETLNDLNFVTGEELVSGGASEWALRGVFYRLNYDYSGKYLFETSGRYDGTSRFPKDSRFGFFPSFSAGWRISEEGFFESLKDRVNNFKVRYSYGSLGNQNVSTYAYISSMSTGQISYLVDNTKLNVVNNPAPVAKNLTWEKSITNNLGMDIDVLNSRLSFSGDYYIRDTKDMLTKGKVLPSVFGASEPKENAADLRTKGWELSLSWKDKFEIMNKPFSYSLTAVLSDYTSKITKFDNPSGILTSYYEGQQLGEIWGYTYDGFFKTTEEAQAWAAIVNQDKINKRRVQAPTAELKKLQAGDIKILDLDGSGIIDTGENTLSNPGDRRVIGNTQPRYSYGLNMSAGWNGFDFSALFQGIGKQNWYPSTEAQMFWHVYARPYDSFIPSNFQKMMWSEDNPNAYFPFLRGYTAQNSELSVANNMYLQDLAYCKLRNMTIGYTLPSSLLSSLKVSNLRVYVSGENLFTWTKLDTDYIDPEETMEDPAARGYPMGKTFSVGAEISF